MIYVLVPAHNEAPTVGLLLWKVRQLFEGFHREYQMIVVNDGSTDASDDVLAPYARTLPLTLLNHRRRRGYAGSLEELLRAALQRTDRPRRDVAVTIRADFSDPPDSVPDLVKRIEAGADIVVADRRRSTGTPRAERLARRMLRTLAGAAVRIPGADDLVGTLRAYRLATIERLVREAGDGPLLAREGWAADVELLVRAARHARRIESVRVGGPSREAARGPRSHFRDALLALRAAFALRNVPPPGTGTARQPAATAPALETAPTPGARQPGRRGGDGGDGGDGGGRRGRRGGRGRRGRARKRGRARGGGPGAERAGTSPPAR